MLQPIKRTLVLAVMLAVIHEAHGFSLLGPLPGRTGAPAPPADWQVNALGYALTGDIGGPMNLGEEYRWQSPTMTYAFDSSFLDYFGQRGVEAVEAALQIMNDLPPVSQMSADLTEFPTENKRINATAQSLQIVDIKSTTLHLLLEIMGLAEPERWTWTLRRRTTETIGGITITNYFVIQRNFDPVTFQPTNQVNDAFYSYEIFDPIRATPTDYADAIEFPLDPLQFSFSSVAGNFPGPGEVYPGLTRDDAGGWRYLLRFQNYNVETLPPNTSLVFGFGPGAPGSRAPGRGGPWTPYVGGTNLFTNVIGSTFSPWIPISGLVLAPGLTNITGTNLTNLVINTALRPGIEKITFVRTDFDSLLGQAYFPQTNFYTDEVITNSSIVPQFVQRVSTFPDLLFTAADLGFPMAGVFPFTVARGNGNQFVNNDLINGNTTAAGPGTIVPPMEISFSNILPGFINSSDGSFIDLTGPNPINLTFVWGSFDATATPPIVFPDELSLRDLEDLVLGQ